MKRYSTLGTNLATFFLLGVGSLFATAEDTASYKIKKIDFDLIDSPVLEAKNYNKKITASDSTLKSKWLEIDLSIERKVAPNEDEKHLSGDIVINYFILLKNNSLQSDGKFSLLTGSITHTDIPVGRKLHAAAFISPQTLSKYFGGKIPSTKTDAIKAIGVALSVNGKVTVIDSFGIPLSPAGDKGWWEDVINDVTSISGLVLEKEKTPFSNLSWDYYLPSKVSP